MSTIPYFDFILSEIEKGNKEIEKVFGNHVHWGLWDKPENADGTLDDFANAAEHMTHTVCDAAPVSNGMRVLDAGCGFGGTIASLNNRFSKVDLVGINIEERQLQRARRRVIPRLGNTITFVQGDACQLPFEANSFDVVMAVECIFHFPSRERFFKEAHKVLKKGGKLVISDFIVNKKSLFNSFTLIINKIIERFYGKSSRCFLKDYQEWASKYGFKPLAETDITKKTIPTYPVVIKLARTKNWYSRGASLATRIIEWGHRLNQVKYMILSYQKI